MSYDDIPEVFRRAFEEAERRAGRGRGDEPPDDAPPKPHPRSGKPLWRDRRVWIVAAVLLFLFSINGIITLYTEWLWFENIGYASVWATRVGAQLIVFVLFFIIAATILLLNALIAMRGARQSSNAFGFQPASFGEFKGLVIIGCLFLAFLFAGAASSQWELLLRFVNRVEWDLLDPVFGRTISFYLFELPVMQFIQGWLIPLLFLTILIVIGLYALHNIEDIRLGRWKPQQLDPLRRHVAILGALLALTIAAGYLLSRYELVYSPRGFAYGASATDLRIVAPILLVNATLMIILAIVFIYNYFRFNWRPIAVVAGLWLLSVFVFSGIIPGLYQRYAVLPNEEELERPFIKSNIEFTRLAYGLDKVRVEDFGQVTNLDQQDLEDNAAALENIRLWDYRVLPENYEQLQALRPYYTFSDVDIDRYLIDGEMRQVMLAARELDMRNLPNDSWVNRRLEFTHGYGIVMNPVDRFANDGQPEFFISDLPPESSVNLDILRPEIYYGELIADPVYVNSRRPEFNYSSGSQNLRTSYAGEGGVQLDSFLKKLALSIRFGDVNLMLSDDITPETRAIFHRQIEERVRQIAPFLALDYDPYLVLDEDTGELVWMVDAYTVSDRFPYSEPSQIGSGDVPAGINYIRNVAKITVSAYDGTVNFYLIDDEEPLALSYAAAFPDLFQPFEAMPESLQQHVRYPESLFLIQTRQYLKYHMTDSSVFYNQEDLRAIPLEQFAEGAPQLMEPYYVIFSLPDEEATEFLLIQPYTPLEKNNMVSWIAARSEGDNYGELVSYELPKQQLVFGPIQVEGRIDQEPDISQQLSLWDQRGSSVIRGNLLVIPLNNSFLYVEPLYLKSDTSALPELRRVIVASGSTVAMRPTLQEALIALLDKAVADAIEVAPTIEALQDLADAQADDAANSADSTPELIGDETLQSLVDSANAHYDAAQVAIQNGDWTTYGNELEALKRDLDLLAQLLEQ